MTQETDHLSLGLTREWCLFALFLIKRCHRTVEGGCYAAGWAAGRPFATPCEWLGKEGVRFRTTWKMPEPPLKTKMTWQRFRVSNTHRYTSDIEAEIEDLQAKEINDYNDKCLARMTPAQAKQWGLAT